jgi:hypothetical protein
MARSAGGSWSQRAVQVGIVAISGRHSWTISSATSAACG